MKPRSTTAFSLIEVTIALGIIAFAMIVIMGLLPAGMSTVRESSEESAATNILAAVAADIRNIPAGQTNTPAYGIPAWSDPVVAQGTLRVDANGSEPGSAQAPVYAVTWTIIPPAAQSANPRYVHVRVAWPGNAPQPTGFVETLVGLDGTGR